MKYIFLIGLFTFSLDNQNTNDDCFDFAVDELEKAESVRGSMMNDEEAFNYMNWSMTVCMGQN